MDPGELHYPARREEIPMLGFFENIGLPELIVILAVLLLVFGASRLPEIARSLGKSGKEFKKGMREGAGGDDETSEKKDSSEVKSD
jgi:sec-independent protein translocase protein TatA